jgi:hypothetical protein
VLKKKKIDTLNYKSKKMEALNYKSKKCVLWSFQGIFSKGGLKIHTNVLFADYKTNNNRERTNYGRASIPCQANDTDGGTK